MNTIFLPNTKKQSCFNRARRKMGQAMKNKLKSMEPEMALFTRGESIRCEVKMERCPSRQSCLLDSFVLKNDRTWMSLVSVFDQTFSKSLMRGANPCGGNRALELIPSGEREERICARKYKKLGGENEKK